MKTISLRTPVDIEDRAVLLEDRCRLAKITTVAIKLVEEKNGMTLGWTSQRDSRQENNVNISAVRPHHP